MKFIIPLAFLQPLTCGIIKAIFMRRNTQKMLPTSYWNLFRFASFLKIIKIYSLASEMAPIFCYRSVISFFSCVVWMFNKFQMKMECEELMKSKKFLIRKFSKKKNNEIVPSILLLMIKRSSNHQPIFFTLLPHQFFFSVIEFLSHVRNNMDYVVHPRECIVKDMKHILWCNKSCVTRSRL